MGELSYVFLLSTKYKLPLKSAASSFILAVIFDYIAVAPIIFVSFFFVEFKNTVLLFLLLGWLNYGGWVDLFLTLFSFLGEPVFGPIFKGKNQNKNFLFS